MAANITERRYKEQTAKYPARIKEGYGVGILL